MIKNKILVVGAGLAGATAARVAAEAGYHVDVIDVRPHVAGNAFDYQNDQGIRVHKYGPHIFHTNNQTVFAFLSRFTLWVDYQHRVKALLANGAYVTLPPNQTTRAIVGDENLINTFFRPYTRKMWGVEIEELDPSILSRVSVRDDDNELYFPNDQFQAMPKYGYTRLVENMLDHPEIVVELSMQFDQKMEANYDHVFNSMPIDVYYDFCHGELPYRSIKFETLTLPLPRVLPAPTVNFTHDGPHTRVTEWKLFPGHGSNTQQTTLTFETPCDYKENNFERYYPVKDIHGENRRRYDKYKKITNHKVTFIGRCGLYVYVDMHQAVSSTAATVNRALKITSNGW